MSLQSRIGFEVSNDRVNLKNQILVAVYMYFNAFCGVNIALIATLTLNVIM